MHVGEAWLQSAELEQLSHIIIEKIGGLWAQIHYTNHDKTTCVTHVV